MKIQKFFLSLIILLFLSISYGSVFAGYCDMDPNFPPDSLDFLKNCAGGTEGVDPNDLGDGEEGVRELALTIASRALQYAALLAVGALVWSGVQYTTAYGDDEKLKHAKTTAIYGLIGLIIALTAFSLVNVIVDFMYGIQGG